MRHGRAKQARKTLQFFQRTVGLKQPYHVLLDGTFVVAFAQHNLPLQERVEKLLHIQHPVIFVTTDSVVNELEILVEKSKDAEKKAVLQQAHDWMVENCSKRIDSAPKVSIDWASRRFDNYVSELSSAGRDMLTVLTDCNGIDEASSSSTNTERAAPPLLVASQDESLLHLARHSGKVPVIRLARGSVLLLEQPSQMAQQAEQQVEREKWTVRGSVPEQEKLLVDLVKQKERQDQRRTTIAPNPHEKRRKRKAKGPNPLSCKKRKDEKPNAKKQNK